MRILVVTRNLPPLLGGMERLVAHVIDELTVDFDVRVCGPEGCARFLPPQLIVIESPLRPLRRFIFTSGVRSISMARKFRPHLVLAGSGLLAPIAWLAARLSGGKSVAYLHGLDIVANHWLYRRVWLPALRNMDAVFANSRNTARLAVSAGISESRISILHPGVEMKPAGVISAATFRARFDLGDRPLLLSIGRLTRRKGLVHFIEKVLPGLVAVESRLMLVIIGEEALDALKNDEGGERERIVNAAKASQIEANIVLTGSLDDAAVGGALAACKALIFPVQDLPGDVEGFGMVAIEAAASGVQTVAFAVGGVSEAVSDEVSGRLLPPGDYAGMQAALLALLDDDAERKDQVDAMRHFAEQFSWPEFGRRLRTLCKQVANQ